MRYRPLLHPRSSVVSTSTKVLSAITFLCLSVSYLHADASDSCQDLTELTLTGTRITSAVIAGPGFLPPANDFSAFQAPVPSTKPFCRVTGVIEPEIRFEVWLPSPGRWNGRLQGAGNGGMAGLINYRSLQQIVEGGYAGVVSDLGHESGLVDGAWAIGRPDRVRDWGHRATHEMTVKAKAILNAYYGKGPEYSYFTGCSGGGRQGLMEAQRYPEDYDGILVGDPTMDFTRLVAGGRLWQVRSNLDATGKGSLLTEREVAIISQAVLRQCDHIDGVSDGVLNDPRDCRLDLPALLCPPAGNGDCLSAAQLAALQKVYRGAVNEKGDAIYPGYLPGGETGRFGWVMNFAGKDPFRTMQWIYARGFLQGLVYEDEHYDPLSFDYDRDIAAMDSKAVLGESLADTINATDTDLEAFRQAGGKIIHYHGWNDPGVSPLRSVQYYEAIEGGKESFYRLFMVPGLQHCFGGPGANQFGATFSTFSAGHADSASHNIFRALEAWVEQGVAPRRIIATKYRNDDPQQGIQFTRPLCPYPAQATYRGAGSEDEAENFVCR